MVYLCVAAAGLRADIIDGFYDVLVPSASTSEPDLRQAASLALQRMLTRASGSESLLQNEALQRALAEPKSYVSQFGIERIKAADGGGLQVKFTFSADVVERLLHQSGEPIWTADRPASLVWMVFEQEGELRFVGAGESAFDTFKASAINRGLPLVEPLYDLEDRFNVSAEQLWQFNLDAIKAASDRYTFNTIIVLRALKDSQGQWFTTWELLNDESPLLGSESCLELRVCFDETIAKIASRWSRRYGVIRSFSRADTISFVLQDASFEKVSSLAAYWRSLPGIDSARVSTIRGREVTFELVWRSDIDTLKQLLGLNENLVPVASADDGNLVYKWF